MRAVIVVEIDMKTAEVAEVLTMHPGNQGFRRNALLFGAQHDWRAVRVVSTNVPAFVADHFLVAHPDVGLDVFDQMAQVNGAVGIGQGGGDKNFARHGRGRIAEK